MSDVLHYTKAAERLHISQPSLSYSISELEKELNLPLFTRSDNKTFISSYGKELLPFAKDVLRNVEAISVKSYEMTDASHGIINLGNIYSVSFDLIPILLKNFYAFEENCQITINFYQGNCKNLTDKLVDGSVDLAFSGWPSDETIEGEYIYTQELKLVTALTHPLASKDEVTLEDVKDAKLISAGNNSNICQHIAQCYRTRGYTANFVKTVAECSALGAFISSDMGVSITSLFPPLTNGNLRVIPFVKEDSELLGRKIYMLWHKDRHLHPAVCKFRSFTLKELKDTVSM
jgi:DNA-binding transcriptional LysR family regulator